MLENTSKLCSIESEFKVILRLNVILISENCFAGNTGKINHRVNLCKNPTSLEDRLLKTGTFPRP